MRKEEEFVAFWHRRDLRVEDNAGLYHALMSGKRVMPIFIFDKVILEKLKDKHDMRVMFIYNYVSELKLKYKNAGSDLYVTYDDPVKFYGTFLEQFPNCTAIYTNHDYEPYAYERDGQIRRMLEDQGKDLRTFKDQVIFEKNEILTNKEEPYSVYSPYSRSWMERFKQDSEADRHFRSEDHLDKCISFDPPKMPSLEEMNFIETSYDFPKVKLDANTLKNYKENRNIPGDEGTSRVGAYLRHGILSIRRVADKAKDTSFSFLNELIWRDFYMMILYHNPHVVENSYRPKYDFIAWRNNEVEFEKWCKGETGYPIVDAGMRQLNKTGYMHNRVRMITASFLTKHLLIDWRWGEAYFAEKLLDYELSSNNGGWQWAAGSGTDAQPYFRIFNPYSQTDKFDKDRTYIKMWVPEVDSVDYPKPMVEHKFARERALEQYKKGLAEAEKAEVS